MTLQPELMDLPDHVLLEIAERVGFPALPNLHKVNRRFHRLLNNYTVDSKIHKIVIDPNTNDSIRVSYYGPNDDPTDVYYESFGDGGCYVRCGNRTRTIYDEYYLNAFFSDLETNLRHQKSELKEFHVLWNMEEDELGIQLELQIAWMLYNRRQALRITHLHVSGYSSQHVYSILPYLAVDSLKTLIVKPDGSVEDSLTVESSEIPRLLALEQCNSVKQFHFNCQIQKLDVLLPVVARFEDVKLNVEFITLDDVTNIITMFLNSPQMRNFSMKFLLQLEDDGEDHLDHLSMLLGESFNDEGCEYWHYRIPEEKNILQIRIPFFLHGARNDMIFSRIAGVEVPEGATINDMF